MLGHRTNVAVIDDQHCDRRAISAGIIPMASLMREGE